MSTFGDFEPEDSWDATDAVRVKLANIVARLRLLLDVHEIGEREHLRLRQAIDDLDDVRRDQP